MTNSRLVYSTEKGRMCPVCGHPSKSCTCGPHKAPRSAPVFPEDGTVRIQLDRKGRKGKSATLVYGLGLAERELQQLAKSLKQLCGSGGSVKDGVVLIQGDHRRTVSAELHKQGYTVKLAGG